MLVVCASRTASIKVYFVRQVFMSWFPPALERELSQVKGLQLINGINQWISSCIHVLVMCSSHQEVESIPLPLQSGTALSPALGNRKQQEETRLNASSCSWSWCTLGTLPEYQGTRRRSSDYLMNNGRPHGEVSGGGHPRQSCSQWVYQVTAVPEVTW